MNLTLTPQLSRASALGLLGVVIAFLWLSLLDPLVGGILTHRSEVAGLHSRLADYRSRAAMSDPLEQKLAGVRRTDPSSSALLARVSGSIAAAKIQRDAKRFIESAGGKILSSQEMPSVIEGSLRRIIIRVSFNADHKGLRDALYNLETLKPFYFLQNMAVRTSHIPRMNTGGDNAGDLSVTAEIFGYMAEAGS